MWYIDDDDDDDDESLMPIAVDDDGVDNDELVVDGGATSGDNAYGTIGVSGSGWKKVAGVDVIDDVDEDVDGGGGGETIMELAGPNWGSVAYYTYKQGNM